MLARFREGMPRFDIRTHDVRNNFSLAQRQRMFFPYLTVLEGSRRFYGQIDDAFFEQILSGKAVPQPPPIVALGTKLYKGEIQPLHRGALGVACQCAGACDTAGCSQKAAFLEPMVGEVYGFINVDGDRLLGGAEYVPSIYVPYDIPRDSETAFLTCLYRSTPEFDYRSAPLSALVAHLKGRFRRILAITDDESIFPNGNLPWFLSHGYEDLGVVFVEDRFCRLHLVEKEL